MSDGKVVVDTELDPSGFEEGLGKLGKLASGGMKATTTAITAVTAALSACAAYSIKVGSDFEAGMSQVEAISSASSKQVVTSTGEMIDGFTALTQKAKEMGSTTKFSATESAEALNYMAMAGWSPQQMYDGLAGVMTLAAASGQDLASTADIVTDALTAFRMEAGDAGHFADILAQVSASANTNVGLMGETFKYVAPLCGTMGYSAEDAAIAIGLMANSGIKGSQAGTALKTAIANMAAPTKQMAAQMQALGIEITNSDGSSKSLMEVLLNLRSSFDGLSASEQAAAASTIFGKEAMSGMLAIINSSDEDFAALTDSIYNCNDAAANMAATMQDNLQGQITILKSGVEGLGIAVYEKLHTPLKNLAAKGVEYIGQLTDAFNSGGFEGLVSEIGNILADVLTEVVEFAPQMVTAAVSVIESFIEGLSSAVPEIGTAVSEVGTTLIEGILTIVPELLTLGIELIISLVEGVAQAAPQLIEAFVQAVGSIISTLIEHTPELLQAGMDLLQSLVDGCLSSLPLISELAPQLIQTLCDNLTTQLPQLLTSATDIIMGLVNGIIAAAPQLLTAAVTIVKSVADFIVINLPLIVQAAINIVTQLGQTIVASIPSLLSAVISVMQGLLDYVVDNLPTIAEAAVEIVTQLCTSLVSLIPQLVPVVTELIMSFFNFVVNNLPTIVQAAIQVMLTLVNGIIAQIPTLIPAVIQIISQIFNSIVSNLPTIIAGALQIITTLAMGLIQAIPHIIAAIPQIIVAIVDGFLNTDWISVGSNIISGIASGISNAASGLVSVAVNAARNAIQAVKSWLGIASPSKRAKKEIGKWILPGIGEGVEETAPQLNDKMEDTAEGMVDAFHNKADDIDTDDLLKKMKDKEEPEKPEIHVEDKEPKPEPIDFDDLDVPPPPVDVSSLVAKMKAGVSQQIGEVTTSVSLKTKTGSGQVSATDEETFDYERMGEAMVQAFVKADVKVECDDRELGRVISDILPT